MAAREAELEQARSRKAAADTAAKELAGAEAALKQAAAQAESLARQEAEFRQRVARHQAALAEEREVREAVARLERARGDDEDLSARRERAAQALSERQEAAGAIEAERVRLEADSNQAETAAREAREAASQAESLAQQVAELEGQIRVCQEAEAALESSRQEVQRLHSRQAGEEQTLRTLRAELADIGARIQALAQASARCPLCEQELGEELRRRLLAQAHALAGGKESSLSELSRAGEEAAALLAQLEAKMCAIQPHVARGGTLQQRLGEAQQRRADACAAASRADDLTQRAAALRRRLEAQDFAPDARRRLADAEAAMAQAAYDPAAHQRVQQEIRSRAGSEKKLGALESARAALPGDEAHLAQVRQALIAAGESRAALERERGRLRTEAADLSAAAAVLKQAEGRRAQAGKERDRLVAERAALSAQVESCRRAREQAQRRRRERDEVERDRVLYGELAEAFGRQGVQALVIETVVPQLTDDANELLGRMTEGRMQVNFATQRERPDGGAAETLDIHISDEMGTRRYELYSGGEAFRVDFAVRVALARLLARRAGAKLQTLVIDEGFGTQDAAARDKLVECINAIQDDFEKVLVITHIDELKDAFQERVEITKDDRGSHIRRQAAAVG